MVAWQSEVYFWVYMHACVGGITTFFNISVLTSPCSCLKKHIFQDTCWIWSPTILYLPKNPIAQIIQYQAAVFSMWICGVQIICNVYNIQQNYLDRPLPFYMFTRCMLCISYTLRPHWNYSIACENRYCHSACLYAQIAPLTLSLKPSRDRWTPRIRYDNQRNR